MSKTAPAATPAPLGAPHAFAADLAVGSAAWALAKAARAAEALAEDAPDDRAACEAARNARECATFARMVADLARAARAADPSATVDAWRAVHCAAQQVATAADRVWRESQNVARRAARANRDAAAAAHDAARVARGVAFRAADEAAKAYSTVSLPPPIGVQMSKTAPAAAATSTVLPFRGDDHRARRNANAAARRATCGPQVARIVGGWVGVGDLVMRTEGADRMLYGRKGTSEWMSEAIARGAMSRDWL